MVDEEPNYEKYNLRQIRDVYHNIDRDAYPERFEKIVKRKKELELNVRIDKAEKEEPINNNKKPISKSHLSNGYKSLIFFVIFLFSIEALLSPEYGSDNLEDYQFVNFIVASTGVKEYTGRHGYFEFELIDADNKRFYIRKKYKRDLLDLQVFVKKGIIVELHYVGTKRSGGRIANLRVDQNEIVKLAFLRKKEKSNQLFSFVVAIVFGVLSVYFFYRRSKNKNSEKIMYL